jgi:hypothetical protein
VQAEYRVSRIDNGDIRSHIDPNNFSTALRQSNDQDIARIGLRHATSADAIWLASWTYTRVDSQFTDSALQDLGFGTLQSDTRSDTSISGYTAELQHLRRIGPAALTAGAGGTELSAHNSFSLDQFIVGFPPFGPPIVSIGDSSQRYQTGYAYVGWDVARGVKLITALSYDNFLDTSVFQTHQWNPKLGLVWAMSERTTLRAAGLRTLKRPFAANQTLEPTQVAGFNQLFDDVDGTDARRYGIGLDYRAADRWFAGVELSTRDLDVPVAAAGGGLARFEPRREQLYRVYLSALPTRQLALSAEYRYEDEERRTPVGYSDSFPQRVTSHLLPVRATYFHPSGLLGRVQVTAVHQRVDAFNGPGTTVGQQSDFALLDLSLGYRLPGRHGLISLEVRNLFDRRFGFEDTDFAGNPRVPLFQPGRTVMLRFALYP